jgi:outer membrane protein assembly factor BamB
MVRSSISFFCALLLAETTYSQEAAPWGRFRGPNGEGIAANAKLPTRWSPTTGLAWTTRMPGPGASSPIIVGSKVFLTCYRGYNVPGERGDPSALKLLLLCIDLKDGAIQWTKEVAPTLPEQERIREGHGYASNTPVADDERVYVFFGKSGVVAFDHAGNEKWRTDVGSKVSDWGSGASPVLYKQFVIVNASVESESLVALDRKSGKEAWRLRGIRESWNTPIVAKSSQGKDELLVAIMGKVLGVHPDTGEELWSSSTDIPWYMAPSMVAKDGIVYALGGRPGGGLAVKLGGTGNVTSSHRLWTSRKGTNVPSPILHEGHLYWAHDNLGVVFCADAKTGKAVYEERVQGADQIYASPVLADGKIYYTNRQGRTFVVAASPKFELLNTNELEPRGLFNASPAVADNRMLIRSDRFLYAIGQ